MHALTILSALLMTLSAAGADAPCTAESLTCPPAVGSAANREGAIDLAITSSINLCTMARLGSYEALCRTSGPRCGTFSEFSGSVAQNGPEHLATGSAVVKCF